jgi:hypothetical protein
MPQQINRPARFSFRAVLLAVVIGHVAIYSALSSGHLSAALAAIVVGTGAVGLAVAAAFYFFRRADR